MQNSFFTIKENLKSELTEKKSRFIANVFCVTSENDAETKIAEVKRENRDARHNVFAYRLESGFERCSDDGEPSGTAGVPILDILRGENLTNVLVVVTRYFGGILLGTGGLVRCYGGATKLALQDAEKVEMKLCKEYKIILEYENYNSLQHYFKNNNIRVLSSNFLDKIEINVLVIASEAQKFLHDLSEITSRTCSYEEVLEYYHE